MEKIRSLIDQESNKSVIAPCNMLVRQVKDGREEWESYDPSSLN